VADISIRKAPPGRGWFLIRPNACVGMYGALGTDGQRIDLYPTFEKCLEEMNKGIANWKANRYA
jgi:hypothetical protein